MGVAQPTTLQPDAGFSTRPGLAWPWMLLVKPSSVWSALRTASGTLWLPAILWQFGAIAVGRLLSAHAMMELDAAVQQSNATESWSWTRFLLSLLALGVLCLIANLALAASIMVAANINGSKLPLRSALVIAVYALLPFALGDALSRSAFAMIQPLSQDISGVWAAHLKPFSLGLATINPKVFPPLSLSWFICSFFDYFGLWSLAQVWLGLRHYAVQKVPRAMWSMLALVILLALAIAAVWQALQFSLLRASQ